LTNIETYAVKYVTFYENTGPREEEILALRFGQLVIDNQRLRIPNKELIVPFSFIGPGSFTTKDLPDLPFQRETPIVTLKANQEITGELRIRKGTSKEHVKWRPISTLTFKSLVEGQFIVPVLGNSGKFMVSQIQFGIETELPNYGRDYTYVTAILGQLRMEKIPDLYLKESLTLNLVGPRILTIKDFQGFTITNTMNIIELRGNERITATLTITKNTGARRVAWSRNTDDYFKKKTTGFLVTINTLGMLPGKEIFRRGFEAMTQTAQDPAVNLFYRPTIPVGYAGTG
jgi:hypothetical protein